MSVSKTTSEQQNAVSVERRTQLERREMSTKMLLKAAGELIVSGGYQAVTLAAVGERAGYSRGLVTARFASKEQLIDTLVMKSTFQWRERTLNPLAEGLDGRGQVAARIAAIRQQTRVDPDTVLVVWALMFESLRGMPLLRDRFEELYLSTRDNFEQFLRMGRRDGSVDTELSPRREAELIIGGLRGVAYQTVLLGDAFNPYVALKYLIDVTDRRLAPSTSGGSTANCP